MNAEGTVLIGPYAMPGIDAIYEVEWDAHGHCFAEPHQLAPLTDPKADEFLERIRKLKPYDEPTVPAHDGTPVW